MRTTAGKSFDIVRSADREPAIIDPASSALFLDIDGTLLDIAPTPGAVVVPPLLVPLLRDAQREFGGAVAIITGRRVSEVDSLLSPLKLVVSGVHGCEIRSDLDAGVLTQSPAIDPDLLAGLYELEQKFSGVFIEPKGSGVAVHYRMAPTRWPELKEQLIRLISNRATQIIISPGRKVFEILPAGISKGTAIERLLSLAWKRFWPRDWSYPTMTRRSLGCCRSSSGGGGNGSTTSVSSRRRRDAMSYRPSDFSSSSRASWAAMLGSARSLTACAIGVEAERASSSQGPRAAWRWPRRGGRLRALRAGGATS